MAVNPGIPVFPVNHFPDNRLLWKYALQNLPKKGNNAGNNDAPPEFNATIENLESKLESYKQQLEKCQESKGNCESELKECEKKVVDLEGQLRTCMKNCSEFMKDIPSLRKLKETADSINKKFGWRIDFKDPEARDEDGSPGGPSPGGSAMSIGSLIDDVSKFLKSLEESLDNDLRGLVLASDDTGEQSTLQKLRVELENSKELVSELKESTKSLTTENEELKSGLERLQERLSQEINSKDNEIARLRDDLKTYKEQTIGERDARLRTLESEKKELQAKLGSLTVEIGKLETLRVELKESIRAYFRDNVQELEVDDDDGNNDNFRELVIKRTAIQMKAATEKFRELLSSRGTQIDRNAELGAVNDSNLAYLGEIESMIDAFGLRGGTDTNPSKPILHKVTIIKSLLENLRKELGVDENSEILGSVKSLRDKVIEGLNDLGSGFSNDESIPEGLSSLLGATFQKIASKIEKAQNDAQNTQNTRMQDALTAQERDHINTLAALRQKHEEEKSKLITEIEASTANESTRNRLLVEKAAQLDKDHEKKMSELELKHQETLRQLQETQTSSTEALDKLRKELKNKYEGEKRRLQQILAKELEEARRVSTALTASNGQASTQNNKLITEAGKLTQELEATRGELSRVNEILGRLVELADDDDLEEFISSTKSDLLDQKNTIEYQKNQLETIVSEKVKLESERKELEKQAKDLFEEANDLLSKKNGDLSAALTKFEEASANLDEKNQQIQAKEDELTRVKTELRDVLGGNLSTSNTEGLMTTLKSRVDELQKKSHLFDNLKTRIDGLGYPIKIVTDEESRDEVDVPRLISDIQLDMVKENQKLKDQLVYINEQIKHVKTQMEDRKKEIERRDGRFISEQDQKLLLKILEIDELTLEKIMYEEKQKVLERQLAESTRERQQREPTEAEKQMRTQITKSRDLLKRTRADISRLDDERKVLQKKVDQRQAAMLKLENFMNRIKFVRSTDATEQTYYDDVSKILDVLRNIFPGVDTTAEGVEYEKGLEASQRSLLIKEEIEKIKMTIKGLQETREALSNQLTIDNYNTVSQQLVKIDAEIRALESIIELLEMTSSSEIRRWSLKQTANKRNIDAVNTGGPGRADWTYRPDPEVVNEEAIARGRDATRDQNENTDMDQIESTDDEPPVNMRRGMQDISDNYGEVDVDTYITYLQVAPSTGFEHYTFDDIRYVSMEGPSNETLRVESNIVVRDNSDDTSNNNFRIKVSSPEDSLFPYRSRLTRSATRATPAMRPKDYDKLKTVLVSNFPVTPNSNQTRANLVPSRESRENSLYNMVSLQDFGRIVAGNYDVVEIDLEKTNVFKEYEEVKKEIIDKGQKGLLDANFGYHRLVYMIIRFNGIYIEMGDGIVKELVPRRDDRSSSSNSLLQILSSMFLWLR